MQKRILLLVAALTTVCISSGAFAHSPIDKERASDLAQLVEQANLIFVGKVEKVAYRNAQGSKQEGLIPYTIVTYRIDQVLRGKAPDKEITMRLIGGPDGRGRFLAVTGVPVIQEGDQDLLFVANTQDPTCPLVFCEHGRYRIMNEQVFDTFGSPVRSIKKSKVISRGLPPKQFQTVRYPTPKFDELMKNPEVVEVLKSQNMSVEDARRRYEETAPKFVQLTEEFPVQEKTGDTGSVARPAGHGTAEGSSVLPAPASESEPSSALATESVPLSKLVEVTRGLTKLSKRTPSKVLSVDPDAEIVTLKVSSSAPKRLAPSTPPSTKGSPDEYKAYKKNGFDPVIQR
jgi:hypothetical protein